MRVEEDNSNEEFNRLAFHVLKDHQTIHLDIRSEVMSMMMAAERLNSEVNLYKVTRKSCVIMFFTLIEFDLYFLGKISRINRNTKVENFGEHSRKIFKNFFRAKKKQLIIEEYFDKEGHFLNELKIARDKFICPKGLEDLKLSENFSEQLRKHFFRYCTLFEGLMNEFYKNHDYNL